MTKDAIKGRAKYVLILIVLLNILYPITSNGSTLSLILFEVLYAGLFIVGIFITSDSRLQTIWYIGIAMLWLVMAVIYALAPTSFWKIQVSSFVLVVFHLTIIGVLLRYIFTARAVTVDVLYASAAVYFLLAFLFVPIYGLLETTIPGSFVDNTLHTPMHWQQFVYYSLVTLSTAGFEATIGVLSVAILMARLVSLYDAQRRG